MAVFYVYSYLCALHLLLCGFLLQNCSHKEFNSKGIFFSCNNDRQILSLYLFSQPFLSILLLVTLLRCCFTFHILYDSVFINCAFINNILLTKITWITNPYFGLRNFKISFLLTALGKNKADSPKNI